MPPNNAMTPTHSPEEFCLALKAARERKGITLAQISDKTKIPSPMFVALERGDLRRWPKGLFRRSFFLGYVKMIGVPVDEACVEFARLFPDDEAAELIKNAETLEAKPEEVSPFARLSAALTDALTQLFGRAGVSIPEDSDEPEMRAWVTDARRVGPAPRIRVRIKVPK